MKAIYFAKRSWLVFTLIFVFLGSMRAVFGDDQKSVVGDWTGGYSYFIDRSERWRVGENSIELYVTCQFPDQSKKSTSINVPITFKEQMIRVLAGGYSVIKSDGGQSTCVAQIDKGDIHYEIRGKELSLRRNGDFDSLELTVATSQP